jgi:prepilin-type N-terminal cleavage/methylation domain-containing protein
VDMRIHASRHRGFTVVEVLVATFVLGIVATALMQATVSLERSLRAAGQFDYASRELDNLLERFVHLPWEEITSEAGGGMQLPSSVTERLPAAKLESFVMDDSFDAKRITMKLRWRSRTGEPTRPVTLTTWVFRAAEEIP